jgi:hypothetical protein
VGDCVCCAEVYLTARAESDREREEFRRTGRSLELWFGLLGGPASGFLFVLVGYPLVDRACVTDSSLWLHVAAIFFLITSILSGVISWRLHERAGDWPEAAGGMMPRVRFMTTVGSLTSILAIVEILFQWIPIFFIGACHGT